MHVLPHKNDKNSRGGRIQKQEGPRPKLHQQNSQKSFTNDPKVVHKPRPIMVPNKFRNQMPAPVPKTIEHYQGRQIRQDMEQARIDVDHQEPSKPKEKITEKDMSVALQIIQEVNSQKRPRT